MEESTSEIVSKIKAEACETEQTCTVTEDKSSDVKSGKASSSTTSKKLNTSKQSFDGKDTKSNAKSNKEKTQTQRTPPKIKVEMQNVDDEEDIEDDDLKYHPTNANKVILDAINDCENENSKFDSEKDSESHKTVHSEDSSKTSSGNKKLEEKSAGNETSHPINESSNESSVKASKECNNAMETEEDIKPSEQDNADTSENLVKENISKFEVAIETLGYIKKKDDEAKGDLDAKLEEKKSEDCGKAIELQNDKKGEATSIISDCEGKDESDSEKKVNDDSERHTVAADEKEDKDSSLDKVPVDDTASDNETSTLAILDVRTVCDDESISESEERSEEKEVKEDAKQDKAASDASETPEEKAVPMSDKEIEAEANVEVLTTDADESDMDNASKKDSDTKAKDTELPAGSVITKRIQGKTCLVCDKMKPCKYQVLMLGVTRYLCDDSCFSVFRNRTHTAKSSSSSSNSEPTNENRPITRSLTKDVCNVCHKDIKNGMGLLPGIGENKPLCSEECMKSYQADQGLKRACAQCGKHIQSRTKCLTWEAMEFCNELCLGNYQMYLGSHCAYCNKAVPQTYIGKYCVRFGLDIKQFCSNGCLEEFKLGLKVCSYCQKDISAGPDGFLAPVGDKGQFKEFCTQSCMEKFELMGSASTQPSFKKCSMCKKLSSVNVEVTFEGKEHKLCSESCVAAFRYVNKINTSICDTCHKFFDLDVSKQLTIQFEGSSKRFCSKACMNVFVLYHRKVVPCSWCRVKKYNFDMIERVDSNNHVQLFCSLNCLSLFRVSLNATSSRRVQCDYCRQVKPAQFHLTMSDASIRNFCTLNCAMHFQGQFTTVAPVVAAGTTTSSDSIGSNNGAGNSKAAAVLTAGTPIISSVVSLAPPTTAQQQTTIASTTQTTKAVFVMSATAAGSNATTNVSFSKPAVPKTSISTQTAGVTVTQQIVLKPPVAKSVKNKAVTCRPVMQTKGVSCKPHPCHKNIQTDDIKQEPVLIPVPVPIYVPVPMRMYSTPVPVPLPFPLPIPVPIFIPTTKNSASGIFKQIKEIQQKIPDNPFEADLILMAEMVAEDSGKDKQAKVKAIKQSESPHLDGSEGESFGMESAQPEACSTPNAFGDDVLQMALRMAEHVDLEAALSSSGTLSHSQPAEENGGSECLGGRQVRSSTKSKRTASRGRGRGRKRVKTEDPSENVMAANSVLPASLAATYGLHTVLTPQVESNCVLKYSYGVNAWKHWVLQKNNQLEKASATNRKLKLFKTDLLQLTADELNYSLCLFVKEVRKPNSEEYAPDSIYYLCLGIQQYLFENGRIDNIFSDAYYEKFTECLNEVLQRYEINLTHDGLFLSRIEEEILWESKQLGAHSPHVLLNTLMYFNTKYFLLKTVDDHLQLSFSHILKHWKKSSGGAKVSGSGGVGCRNVLLRYYPPSQTKETNRRKKESIPAYEQVENVENPLRCPVKLYEFYLSKCSPESIKSRNDVFYLYPERSCVPDSPVWYSTMPLGKDTIAKMLQRIRMVREVGEAIMAAS